MNIENIPVGLTFTHTVAIDNDWKPNAYLDETYADAPKAKCVVTAVRDGWVYFKYVNHLGKSPFKARDTEFLETQVGEIISD